MKSRDRTGSIILVFLLGVGILPFLFRRADERAVEPRHTAAAALHVSGLQIVNQRGETLIRLSDSGGAFSMLMTNKGKTHRIEFGVHPGGDPAALISDDAVKNFGLLRTEGSTRAPICVLSGDDIPRVVAGISIGTPKDRSPFWVLIDETKKRTDFVGRYTYHYP